MQRWFVRYVTRQSLEIEFRFGRVRPLLMGLMLAACLWVMLPVLSGSVGWIGALVGWLGLLLVVVLAVRSIVKSLRGTGSELRITADHRVEVRHHGRVRLQGRLSSPIFVSPWFIAFGVRGSRPNISVVGFFPDEVAAPEFRRLATRLRWA